MESILLKVGRDLGLESEHSSRFLCSARVDSFAKKNSKSAQSSIRVRGKCGLDAYEILNVYMIRWCDSEMMIPTPCSPVERQIPGYAPQKSSQLLFIGALLSLTMHICTQTDKRQYNTPRFARRIGSNLRFAGRSLLPGRGVVLARLRAGVVKGQPHVTARKRVHVALTCL